MKITAAHVCKVTGYNRDQLRGLLQKLPPFAEGAASPRIAREFSRHDLLVLCVAVRLETKHGLKRTTVAAVIEQIQAELRGPRPANASPLLRISIDPPSATYLAEKYVEGEGTVVALGPVFQQVDDYFGGGPSENNPQSSLPFGLNLAAMRQSGKPG